MSARCLRSDALEGGAVEEGCDGEGLGLGWPAELTGGTVVLAGLVGYALTLLPVAAPVGATAAAPAPTAR